MNIQQKHLQIAGAVVGGLLVVAGAFEGGRRFERNRLNDEYNQKMEEEIERTRRHYTVMEQKPEPEEIAAEVEEEEEPDENVRRLLEKYQGGDETVAELVKEMKPRRELEVEVVEKNIFAVETDGFDYEEELKNRSPLVPYVISRAEFEEAEPGHDIMTCTWYDGDSTLCDERDQMIDDVEGTVGEANLARFGAGSDDPNIVYIRNEKRGLDIEVVLSHESYAAAVMGFNDDDEEELRHSYKRPRKFRPGDDE